LTVLSHTSGAGLCSDVSSSLLASAAAVPPLTVHAERPLKRILYFTGSASYRHDVIPLSKAILTQMGSDSGVFEVNGITVTGITATVHLIQRGVFQLCLFWRTAPADATKPIECKLSAPSP